MRTRRLLVVGAGPAGCAAAVAARRAAPGVAVTVVDLARFPRDKPCGGAITGGGLRELGLAGLVLRVPCVVATHAVLRAGGRCVRVALPRPAIVVRRRELDDDLVRQAREAGAEVIEGAALRAIEGGVALTTRGPLAFDALVAADGVGGATRRALGLGQGRRVPLREAVSPAAPGDDLVFDLDASRAGYAWRFPCLVDGRRGQAWGVYSSRPEPRLGDALERFGRGEGLALAAAQPAALRTFDPAGPVGAGRALLAGDALGADPLCGEGIRYALWSGRIAGALAAAALLRGRAPSAVTYRRRLLASRSGVVLEVAARASARLYGNDPRWRRLALDRDVAEALAALVSGEPPARPLLRVVGRLPWFLGPAPARTDR